jgi:hypothetical protein
VTGGFDDTGKAIAQILYYDPKKARLEELPVKLANARYGHEATLLSDGSVLVTGGFDATQLLASVELIQLPAGDPSRATVVSLAALPEARSDHRAVLLASTTAGSGGVLLVGGFVPVPGARPVATASALLYRVSPEGGTSVQISQPRVARFDHAAVVLPGPDGSPGNERVVVFGGMGFDPLADGPTSLAPLASGEVYEPAMDRWSSLRFDASSDLSAAGPRRGHRGARLQGGAALFVAGRGAQGAIKPALILELDGRDAGLGHASRGASLARGRRDAEVGELEDGRVVVAGGIDPANNSVLDDAEVFAANGRSVEAPISLGGGRYQDGLASLGARVLIVGGTAGGTSGPGSPTAGLLLFGR